MSLSIEPVTIVFKIGNNELTLNISKDVAKQDISKTANTFHLSVILKLLNNKDIFFKIKTAP